MKKIIIFALIAIICSSCLKQLEDEGVYTTITYKGRLVDKSSLQPISGMVVQITDGTTVQSQMTTLEDGIFQLDVALEDITSDYYLQLSGHADYPLRKGRLVGFGKQEYDYADILVESNKTSLSKFQHNGNTYYVHSVFASTMNWYQAIDACENLTYEGFSDWILPPKEILNTMFINKTKIGSFLQVDNIITYWSSSDNNTYAWVQFFWSNEYYSEGEQELFPKDYRLNVRCIRKAN